MAVEDQVRGDIVFREDPCDKYYGGTIFYCGYIFTVRYMFSASVNAEKDVWMLGGEVGEKSITRVVEVDNMNDLEAMSYEHYRLLDYSLDIMANALEQETA